MSAVHALQGLLRKAAPVKTEVSGIDIDRVLLLCMLILLSLGLVMVSSASVTIADKQLGDPFYFTRRQISFVGLGLLFAVFVQRIRLVHWEKSGMALVLFAFFLLLLVLLPGMGRTVNGATRWLELGVIGLQVSEPARLLLLIYLAGYLVRRQNEVRASFKGFIKPVAVLGLACMFILAQPDFGSGVVLLLTCLGMMFLAGVQLWRFAILLFAMAGVLAVLAVSSPYRLQRLTTFLDPWADPYNSGFQLTQSLIAFGSGGWQGVGLGASVQKLFYLPEAHNDFLFAILAEELGLIGVHIVILLFALLVWRIIRIAMAAKHEGHLFGAYLAYGIGLWVAIQTIINLGVNMGILPTKGLTLPLISAGGSSLLVMCTALGLVLRVHQEVMLTQSQALRKSARKPKSKPKKPKSRSAAKTKKARNA